ncbi:LysR substrate-binding domain-containing protein [Nonomuraea sp. NPDC049695]|uniref:LysR family transcriptional regulator n=1 Tax=Nonomuraea sp. NPDC049695 TaxID=3154734 RepID=UPI0034380E96
MELRQLRYLVATAEEASFTRAAARVHVAQPAVSQQIAQLERELGQQLFDRSDRRIRLTPAGEAFLPYAQAALEAAAAGRDAVDSLRGILAGKLAIGAVQSPPEPLIGLLGDFQRRHPRVDITLRIGHPKDLAADVAGGTVDAAFIGIAGQQLPAVLATRELYTEPLVVAIADDHPIARHADTTLNALRDEPIVTLTHGSGLRNLLDTACARAGFAPRIRAETDDVALLADLVHHGLGIALLPSSVAERSARQLTTVALRSPALQRRIALAWHRHRSTAPGRAFLEFAETSSRLGTITQLK